MAHSIANSGDTATEPLVIKVTANQFQFTFAFENDTLSCSGILGNGKIQEEIML